MKLTPRMVSTGIKDSSKRPLVPQPEQIPQHLPLIYSLAERGTGEPQMAIGDAMLARYGSATFDQNSAYYTHQTALCKVITRNGNQVMFKRLIPANAKKALLRLSLELIPTELPVYERTSDGGIRYSQAGPLGTPIVSETINGYRGVWYLGVDHYVGTAKNFGQGTIRDTFRLGSVTGSGGQPLGIYRDQNALPVVGESKLYPILDMEVDTHGAYGNRLGLRIQTPTSRDVNPLQIDIVEVIKAFLYRFGLVERDVTALTPNTTATTLDEAYLDLGFPQDLVHPRIETRSLSFEDNMIDSYAIDDVGFIPVNAPFGAIKVYHEYLGEVLNRLTQGELIGGVAIKGEKDYDVLAADYGRTGAHAFTDTNNAHLFNLFNGVDVNGVPYFASDLNSGSVFGGINIGPDTILYASGGDDGLAVLPNGKPNKLENLRMFDEMVRNEASTFGSGEYPLLDIAKYPISAVWDSGYSVDTKTALLRIMARRQDVFVVLTTQSVADYVGSPIPENWKRVPVNTESEELSLLDVLSQAALLYPESTINNTPACRAAVVGHAGELITESGRQILPLTFDLAHKVSKYMGASDGRWVNGSAFDSETGKLVEIQKNINLTSKTTTAYDRAWANGLIWVQNWDRASQFYPSYQTVYPDETSVLNSLIVSLGMCTIQKVAFDVWKSLTGNGALNDRQLIQRSDELIRNKTVDRFDGRLVVVPRTQFTPSDIENGNSWSAEITVYANTERTLQFSTTVARRMSELQ